jgi:hypothetical protein
MAYSKDAINDRTDLAVVFWGGETKRPRMLRGLFVCSLRPVLTLLCSVFCQNIHDRNAPFLRTKFPVVCSVKGRPPTLFATFSKEEPNEILVPRRSHFR